MKAIVVLVPRKAAAASFKNSAFFIVFAPLVISKRVMPANAGIHTLNRLYHNFSFPTYHTSPHSLKGLSDRGFAKLFRFDQAPLANLDRVVASTEKKLEGGHEMLRRTVCLSLASMLTLPRVSFAEKFYDRGASDTEIKLGQTMPFSGPVSAAATVGRASIAYFDAINKAGGINGRLVKLLSIDDGFNPSKTVEATRWLVESEEVLFIYGSVGVQGSAAVQKYLNTKKVPQLFLSTGASRFNDPKNYPWSMAIMPSYAAEGKALARFALESISQPKVAILYQNDDLGKDFAGGFKAGLGDKASSLIVSEQTFEVSDPTIDSRVVSAKASGANIFYFAGTQKFGAMQIRALGNLDWKPLHLVCSISSGVESVLRQAGLENSEGLLSSSYYKDPFDPGWRDDPDIVSYLEWMRVNIPQGNPADPGYILGYISSGLVEYVLRQAQDNLTRARILDIATHLDNPPIKLLLPGITLHTSPANYSMINKFQIQKFNKGRWTPVGDVVSVE